MEVKVDLTGWQTKVAELNKAVPAASKDVFTSQARLLVEALVAATVPHNLERTENSIRATANRAYVATKDRKLIQTLDPTLYTKAHRTGRATGKARQAILDKRQAVTFAALRAIEKVHLDRIGLLKAGWLGSGNPLNARKFTSGRQKEGIPPRFVKRHQQHALGDQTISPATDSISISIKNRTPYVLVAAANAGESDSYDQAAQDAFLQTAVATRIECVDKLIKRINSGAKVIYQPK